MAAAQSAALFQAALHGDGRAQRVRPDGVLKADGLHTLDDRVNVDALGEEHLAAGVQRLQAV